MIGAAGTFLAAAGYHVTFLISCRRPSSEALAFLGPLRATAQYLQGRCLQVNLEVDADDVVEALAVGRRLVLDRLPGDVGHATVTAVDGLSVPPGRLFRRKRNR